ncbi:hypothetical protein EVAR_8763_1 [Eumeta japonica]|uniref:Uncharacterized protein n=1 Tax=Eumeta variegata TaxID=151549 RepID=A0A4C1TTQ3_EUMVA|nr:hypothetical protein EVAR_8763_1 [Eumeta japonica]
MSAPATAEHACALLSETHRRTAARGARPSKLNYLMTLVWRRRRRGGESSRSDKEAQGRIPTSRSNPVTPQKT